MLKKSNLTILFSCQYAQKKILLINSNNNNNDSF